MMNQKYKATVVKKGSLEQLIIIEIPLILEKKL